MLVRRRRAQHWRMLIRLWAVVSGGPGRRRGGEKCLVRLTAGSPPAPLPHSPSQLIATYYKPAGLRARTNNGVVRPEPSGSTGGDAMSQSAALEAVPSDGSEPHPIQLVANVVQLLEVAHDSFDRDRDAAKASISRATLILRSELERRETASKIEFGVGKLAGWQVLRLRTFVDSHLGDSIQVGDLSRIARRSTAHFCRAFKRTFGQTPHAYVTARRLHRAKSLMLESNEQLSVIAVLCGFTDQAHLSKLFRQHTGETPGAWRRQRSNGDDAEASAWPLRA
jgi:AraC family transcriptional regulator